MHAVARLPLSTPVLALALVACSEPAPPTVTLVDSAWVWEGLGCGQAGCPGTCNAAGCPGGRRAGLVVAEVDGEVTAARATVPGVSAAVSVDVLAQGGGRVALAVRVPITAGLAAGDHPLALQLDTAGGVATVTTTVRGLDELVLANRAPVPPPGPYSTVIVPTAIVAQLEGDDVARLVATGDVVLAGILSADGTAERPGPAGCPGAGHVTEPARCSPGNGLSSATAAGGGGGFGTGGAGGGLGGAATGDPWLVPLGPATEPAADQRGHGGGAHLDDAGGHGGGAVLLSSFGRVVVGQYARVTARGGAPAPAVGLSGGGGSGGALVVSAAAGLELSPAASLPFEATGGGPAAVRGGDGRVRLDSPDELAGFTGATPAPWRGPAWQGAPLVVGGDVDLTVRIDPSVTAPLTILVDGAAAGTCTPVAGQCPVHLALPAGVAEVCVVLRPALSPSPPENQACVAIARVDGA